MGENMKNQFGQKSSILVCFCTCKI